MSAGNLPVLNESVGDTMETMTDTNPRTDYESTMLAYAQETRDAAIRTQTSTAKIAGRTNFIAWCVGIFAALSLIGMLWGVVTLVHFSNAVTTSSSCYSQGGTDTSC